MPDLATALREYVDQAPAVSLDAVATDGRRATRRGLIAMSLSGVALFIVASLVIFAVQNTKHSTDGVVAVTPSTQAGTCKAGEKCTSAPTSASARGILGVFVVTAPPPGSNVTVPRGAQVSSAVDPARKAGLRKDDVIVAINGTAIASAAQLSEALARLHPGDVVYVTWTDTSHVAHTAAVTLARFGG